MNENNLNGIPDLNQALSFAGQYEEYNYLQVWGLFLLMDAIQINLFHYNMELQVRL